MKPNVLTKCAFLGALIISAACFADAYSGGDGLSPATAYRISTPDDWIDLMETPADWTGKYFVLTGDICLANVLMSPIGSDTSPFTGIFDGNDHTLTNAVILQPDSDTGLFGWIGPGGQISRLRVVAIDVEGITAGGLAAYNEGTIRNCHFTGTVIASYPVGGLVGNNSGSIDSSSFTGEITGDAEVGGLVGWNYGSISFSHAVATVEGYFDSGGLVGSNDGMIANCYAKGSVTAHNIGGGGLAGYSGKPAGISNSYAMSSVNGGAHGTGGLVGWNEGSVSFCYATGAVSGRSDVGGLIGSNDGVVSFCYATGPVNGSQRRIGGLAGDNSAGSISFCYSTAPVAGGIEHVGGMAGSNYVRIHASFWDTQTSGMSNAIGNTDYNGFVGAEGKTADQMKTAATFTAAGWDFLNIWGINEGLAAPHLQFVGRSSIADLNASGTVDLADLAIFAAHWLE